MQWCGEQGINLNLIKPRNMILVMNTSNTSVQRKSPASLNNIILFSIRQKVLFSAFTLIGKFAPKAHFYSDTDTNDTRCTREVKSRSAMPKAAFNKTTTVMTSTLDLKLKEETGEVLHWKHSFVWC
jgi:hypothetical protein